MPLDTTISPPTGARTFTTTRAVRLADMDATERVRLDAVARWLQDIAIDDVAETGWGAPEHLWFVRRIRVDVLVPLLADVSVELVTWCSGVAALAAGRRWSVTGDQGGRIEVDSVWIHLDSGARPARIGDFGVYADAAAGRTVSTRFRLHDPPPGSPCSPWQLRSADVDVHGHVNNAVHWEIVEDSVIASGYVDPRAPLRAELEYREPLDLGDTAKVVVHRQGPAASLAILAGDSARAVARVEPLAGYPPPVSRSRA